MNHGSIPVSGTDLSFVERGVGEPIIFVHGSLGSFRDFRDQLRHFSEKGRAIAYSRRFHPPNRCDDPEAAYTVTGHADDLAGFITGLGLGAVKVAASSWGAYAALDCAVRHPGSIARLVVGEPPMLYLLRRSKRGEALLGDFHRTALDPARRAFERGDAEEGVVRFFDGVAGSGGAFDSLPAAARSRLLECGPELRLEFLTPPGEYMPEIADTDLRDLAIPVLLLTGEESPALFSVITDELQALLPNAGRAVVPRAAHAMQVSNASSYNTLVGGFFAQH